MPGRASFSGTHTYSGTSHQTTLFSEQRQATEPAAVTPSSAGKGSCHSYADNTTDGEIDLLPKVLSSRPGWTCSRHFDWATAIWAWRATGRDNWARQLADAGQSCYPAIIHGGDKSMKILTGCPLIILLLAGCARWADIPEAQCLVYTTLNHHAITTWVNDEPILVCDNVYNGYNKPFWLALRKGENTVHFTASRLPATATPAISEVIPGQQDDNTTVVKIIAGGIFHPKDLIEWKVTKDAETSPRWTVQSGTGYRPSLEQYEDVGLVNEDMLQQITAFLERFQKALQERTSQRSDGRSPASSS